MIRRDKREEEVGVDVRNSSRENIPSPLIFILLFYFGTIIAFQKVFPVLQSIYPQTVFAGVAIFLSFFHFFTGSARLKLESVQKLYISYCIIATIGLYRSHEVGLLVWGESIVADIWKHLVFLMIIIAFTKTITAIAFTYLWINVTVAIFLVHSVKAIASGYSGLDNRFDSYIGLISNSDNVGVFAATFGCIFLHVGLKTEMSWKRFAYIALSLFSFVIMIKTHTRTAVFVLGVMLPWLIVVLASKDEMMRRVLVVLVLAVVLVVVGAGSTSREGSYFDRIGTIANFGSEKADFNVRSRIFMWLQGIDIGLQNPLLGVGSGASTPYLNLNFEGIQLQNRQSKVAGFSLHNTFIQIFIERGVTGLGLFCLILLTAYKNFNEVAQYAKGHGDRRRLVLIADAGRLYFVGYSAGSMFITIDYDWTLYAYLALSVSLKQYVDRKIKEKTIEFIATEYAHTSTSMR